MIEHKQNRKRTIRNLLFFVLLVTIVAWVGPLLGGDPSSPGIGFLIWGIAPIGVALFVRLMTRDWKDFGIQPVFRKNMHWYFVSLLTYPVVLLIILCLGTLSGAITFHDFSFEAYLSAFLPALLIFSIFAIFEEVGWRGYLAPKLYSLNLNFFVASALVALVWASWHLPYITAFSSYTTEGLSTFLPRFFLGVFAFSILYGEIRERTGSFWPAVIMHGIGNGIANPLLAGFVTLTAGKEFFGSFGADGVVMIFFFGLFGILLHRQRMNTLKVKNTFV